ncbi:MAG: hypothetical protein ACRD50_11795 [Candidatus Acidiferrales bacterium]
MMSKITIAGMAMGALFLLSGAGTAKADDWGGCESHIRHEQNDLNRAINRHGYWSPQAQKERRDLHRALANCGYFNEYRGGDRNRDNHWRRDRDGDRDRY